MVSLKKNPYNSPKIRTCTDKSLRVGTLIAIPPGRFVQPVHWIYSIFKIFIVSTPDKKPAYQNLIINPVR